MLVIIGWGNVLISVQHQAITRISADSLWIYTVNMAWMMYIVIKQIQCNLIHCELDHYK